MEAGADGRSRTSPPPLPRASRLASPAPGPPCDLVQPAARAPGDFVQPAAQAPGALFHLVAGAIARRAASRAGPRGGMGTRRHCCSPSCCRRRRTVFHHHERMGTQRRFGSGLGRRKRSLLWRPSSRGGVAAQDALPGAGASPSPCAMSQKAGFFSRLADGARTAFRTSSMFGWAQVSRAAPGGAAC